MNLEFLPGESSQAYGSEMKDKCARPVVLEVSKCGPWISDITITWELLEMQIPGPHPRLAESEMGKGPSHRCFNKSSR